LGDPGRKLVDGDVVGTVRSVSELLRTPCANAGIPPTAPTPAAAVEISKKRLLESDGIALLLAAVSQSRDHCVQRL
jgi:hypothetical protein